MTESALPNPASTQHSMARTLYQVALWIVVAMKATWFALALAFIGVEWQMLAFGVALVLAGAAAWFFGKGAGALGLGLAWAGVLLAIAVGYCGGVPTGQVTDRIHGQFKSHFADYAFLALALLQFWVLFQMGPSRIVTADAG